MTAITQKQKVENLLKFIKKEIKRTKTPWISWKKLLQNVKEIVGKTKRPEGDLWPVIASVTYSMTESKKDPDAGPFVENPRLYQYKVGNTWYYIPVKMINLYVDSDEL